jgi:hypothetical protein
MKDYYFWCQMLQNNFEMKEKKEKNQPFFPLSMILTYFAMLGGYQMSTQNQNGYQLIFSQ